MKYWNAYTSLISRRCSGAGTVLDLSYWRNNLFSAALIYLLPLCTIALVPGLYWIFKIGQPVIAMVDLAAVTGMAIIAFVPGIRLTVRKIIFISIIYLFSCALLFFVGLSGPGLIYLLASSVFSILIFPSAYRYWPAFLNTFICLLFTLAVFLHFIPTAGIHAHLPGEWMAISSNLVFLSFLLAALIPRLFSGLQQTIEKEQNLTEAIHHQQWDLQRALEMLQQKNNELEQFAYVASHDLKEPLRMVTNFMGLLKNKYANQLDEKAQTYIGFAIDGGIRMQRMIADLLELSRTARQQTDREMADFNEVLIEVKLNIFKLIDENSAQIIQPAALPSLMVYRGDITRLMQNLLINAIKFRKSSVAPVITILAEEREPEWLFCVRDNGIGIEQEKFSRIFEIFARLHSHETYEGTGIGLAVCKKVVEYHGGRIWVESTEGAGSCFYFTIKKSN